MVPGNIFENSVWYLKKILKVTKISSKNQIKLDPRHILKSISLTSQKKCSSNLGRHLSFLLHIVDFNFPFPYSTLNI